MWESPLIGDAIHDISRLTRFAILLDNRTVRRKSVHRSSPLELATRSKFQTLLSRSAILFRRKKSHKFFSGFLKDVFQLFFRIFCALLGVVSEILALKHKSWVYECCIHSFSKDSSINYFKEFSTRFSRIAPCIFSIYSFLRKLLINFVEFPPEIHTVWDSSSIHTIHDPINHLWTIRRAIIEKMSCSERVFLNIIQ